MTRAETLAEVGRLADLYDGEKTVTETERWVNGACERIVASGHTRLYRDLYKDIRERLPCGMACRLIANGLDLTRQCPRRVWTEQHWRMAGARARAVAALKRLERYDRRRRFCEAWKTGDWSNAES